MLSKVWRYVKENMSERQKNNDSMADILKNKDNYDIKDDRMAIHVLNHVLRSGNTAELYIGKYGLVIREIKRKLKYDQAPK